MKKIEKRTFVCLALTLLLLLGLGLFVLRFFLKGGDWASFAANRHLYNSNGSLAVGRVLDRDGDVLSWVDESGNRQYYENATVRKATLHAVGDLSGSIGTSALVAFADQLSGYNFLTGADNPFGQGNDLYLTLDARLNYIAYQAMNGKKGAVGVYNYETGEILCMVSTPTFDPANPPTIEDGDPEYEGVYLNRFLSGTFTPGSVFKTITLTAAIENIPDLFSRSFTCTGSTTVGGEEITCPFAHGEMDINSALANSCNGVFAQLATELGAETMIKYVEKAGILDSYSVDGIATAKGSFDLTGASTSQIGWSGVGQYNDLVNPCAMMVWMGAIANQGKTAVPYLIFKTEGDLPLPSLPHFTKKTDQLIDADTAQVVGDMMANNVRETYGSSRFPNMDICAKSGTAEVGGGKKPNAWFAGFLRNSDAPYAFVVVLEEGGSGANAAGNVAAQVLDALVNGY